MTQTFLVHKPPKYDWYNREAKLHHHIHLRPYPNMKVDIKHSITPIIRTIRDRTFNKESVGLGV